MREGSNMVKRQDEGLAQLAFTRYGKYEEIDAHNDDTTPANRVPQRQKIYRVYARLQVSFEVTL